MTGRYRLVGAVVTPLVVWDDGDELTEQTAQPIKVTSAQLNGLRARLLDELAATPPPVS